jgi:hypothetical protein
MKNSKKLLEFKRITRELNKIGTIPVLYGSLGLSESINRDLLTDDIDILIEDKIFNSKFKEIHSSICALGYELIDTEEHEYKRNQFKIGLATDGDMIGFSGINPSSLQTIDDNCKYRVLSPVEYLLTYEASNLDGYRKEKHKKDDTSKIKLIKSILKA